MSLSGVQGVYRGVYVSSVPSDEWAIFANKS